MMFGGLAIAAYGLYCIVMSILGKASAFGLIGGILLLPVGMLLLIVGSIMVFFGTARKLMGRKNKRMMY
jgi:uncharacterized membrane protein